MTLLSTISFPVSTKESNIMHLHLALIPILAIIAGILVLVIPKAFHYIVAIFLLVYGVLGLLGLNHVWLH